MQKSLDQSLSKKYPIVTIRIDNDSKTIVVAWNTREYSVYGEDKLGNWGANLMTIQGPKANGCMITLNVSDGVYKGTLVRCEIDGNVSSKDAYRQPYFYSVGGIIPIKNGYATSHIEFGSNADTKMIEQVYQEIEKSIKLEFGESDRKYDPIKR